MRYVITADVAIDLAEGRDELRSDVQLLAPTLLRSQVLAELYRRSLAGDLDRAAAREILDGIRRFRIRLLGDRVLQAKAWSIATELGWDDTFDAEYVALTGLQADALVTTETSLAEAASAIVEVGRVEDLIQPSSAGEDDP